MSSNNSLKWWVKAARLRTLPLALSGILLGSLLANWQGVFHWNISILSLLTAISLQVLSNFANDYGDFVKGTDDSSRTDRALASGAIRVSSMKKAIWITAILSLFFGIFLLFIAFHKIEILTLLFFGVGVLAIAAAIGYTVGKKAYGYLGVGDIVVFIFFGLVTVIGVFILQTGSLSMQNSSIFLPAIGLGFLSVGVLNINNIRDIEGDRSNNKNTIVTRIGKNNAEWYHLALITLAFGSFYSFLVQNDIPYFSCIYLFPFLIIHWVGLKNLKTGNRQSYNKHIKILVLLTLIFVLLFGFSIN